ncbi:hypothetical protein GHT06_001516 [Daphnia sinensis]|uniref:Uncharacterized protein n=1 Tax=Daphnia sinensis TaxID=1820382 RepID=A0AAD5KEE0_9CRUS|nr:hypothetical protein GHT06_001516 [Daphnia sinensis]
MVDVVVCYDQPGSVKNATSERLKNILRLAGFFPWLSGPLDHETPRTRIFARYLVSTVGPGVHFDSRPETQQSRAQWKWCVPTSIMVHQTPKTRTSPFPM